MTGRKDFQLPPPQVVAATSSFITDMSCNFPSSRVASSRPDQLEAAFCSSSAINQLAHAAPELDTAVKALGSCHRYLQNACFQALVA